MASGGTPIWLFRGVAHVVSHWLSMYASTGENHDRISGVKTVRSVTWIRPPRPGCSQDHGRVAPRPDCPALEHVAKRGPKGPSSCSDTANAGIGERHERRVIGRTEMLTKLLCNPDRLVPELLIEIRK